MCGIVGYIGNRNAVPILIEGIKRLEYRGYDSAGIAGISNNNLFCHKSVSKVVFLEEKVSKLDLDTNIGIVHTRWATHGEPSIDNAHPHVDCKGDIAIVHNGIIENYDLLKTHLESDGHVFASETDTEVLAHLIEKFFDIDGDFELAVRNALKHVVGAYGIAVINSKEPDKLIAAKNGSPIVVAIGKDEYFVASDVAPIIEHTKDVVYLDDNEMATITKDGYTTKTIDNVPTSKKVEEVMWDIDMIERDGYDHFMLKEIHEQPVSILNAMRGRFDHGNECLVKLGGLEGHEDVLAKFNRIVIIACGTSWHAGLIGEYMIEAFLRTPVEVEYASEFRYRNPVVDSETLVIAISQSGETADTLAGVKLAKEMHATVLGVCNVVGSSIARESDFGIYLHAGPEIGVASTKAFTSQITALYLLTLYIANLRNVTTLFNCNLVEALKAIPDQVASILKKENEIEALAELYKSSENFLYLGRGYNYPVALEGALKLKEISYIHAEGMPAAEMKHGPIALITKDMPVVFIAIQDAAYQKALGNIREVAARGGKVIAIGTEGDDSLKEKADHVFYIPKTIDMLTPLLSVIPLQLLAYKIAVMRECDVDMPRNLAKSVTVE